MDGGMRGWVLLDRMVTVLRVLSHGLQTALGPTACVHEPPPFVPRLGGGTLPQLSITLRPKSRGQGDHPRPIGPDCSVLPAAIDTCLRPLGRPTARARLSAAAKHAPPIVSACVRTP